MHDTPRPIVKRRPPPPPLTAQPASIALAEPPVTRGWRTKAEPWMVGVLSAAIERGEPVHSAAGLLRVSKTTLLKWIHEGAADGCRDPLLAELSAAVYEARSKAISTGVRNLQTHARKDWKAQLELLRAQDPDAWSPQTRSKVEVTHVEAPEDLSVLTEEELLQREMIENKLRAAKALPA